MLELNDVQEQHLISRLLDEYDLQVDQVTFLPLGADVNTAVFKVVTDQVVVDPMLLAYYRCERIIQDIAAYCQQLLLTDEGGEDREQSLVYFTGQFLPGHEVHIAIKTDE